MGTIKIAVVRPFTPPPSDAQLVIFCGEDRPYIQNEIAEYMLTEAKRYAKSYEVCLIPEIYETGETLGCCFFDSKGTILGSSSNAFLNLNYRGRLRRGKGHTTIVTPFGNIALLVDVDISYPQVARLSAMEKADLIIALSYIERMDFYPEMVTYKASAAALNAGVSVVWATSCGTAIVDENGEATAPFSWVLPYQAEVSINPSGFSEGALKHCQLLLENAFKQQEEGGKKDGEL